MLRAIIADDEHRILKLLRNLIDWEEMGFEIIAEAADGMEAYQLTAKFKPDVLITDIRLPVMSGLDVAREVHSTNPEISIIIISGHKHFEYAHTAFKHGVIDYLVKPINSTDLISALQRVKEQKNNSELLWINEKSQAKVNNTFIDDCLHYKMNLDSIEKLNQEYQYNFQQNLFTVFIHYFTLDRDSISHEKLFDKLKKLYQEYFHEISVEIIFHETEYGLIGIVNFQDEKTNELYRLLESSYERMSVELDIWANLQSTIVVGDTIGSVSDFPSLFRKALNTLFTKCVEKIDRTIYVSDFSWEDEPELLIESERVQLVKIIERFSTAELTNWIQEKFDNTKDIILEKPWTAYLLASSILTFCHSILPMSQDSGDSPLNSDVLLVAESLDELVKILIDTLNDRVETKYSEKKSKDSQPITLSKTFMVENLSEQITVEDVARAVNLSYAYFSNLFKSETGVTASQFLLDVRLEKAKDFLRNSSYNLSEIAIKVGYTDAKHFSRIFSKNVGVKTKDYRRLYS